DTKSPTVTVTGSSPTLNAGQTDTITFTFSEAVTGFDNADVSVTNGQLSTITQVNGTTYTAVFTPTADFQGQGSLQGGASGTGTSSWTDTAGNPGTASNTFSITEDTRQLTIPFGTTLTLTGDTLTVPTIENDGRILVQSNPTSTIIGDITGTGLIEIKNNSTLDIDGSVGSGLTVQFDIGQGVPPVLVLTDPSEFHATIKGFQGRDQIHLIGMTPDQAAAWAASITFEGFTGTLKFTSDGSGGTIVSDPPASTTTVDASTATTDASTTTTDTSTTTTDASTTTTDPTVTSVAKTSRLTATKTTSSQTKATSATVTETASSRTNATSAAADEAIVVALSTAVAVAVALDTAVADPGKMSSLTISGDGTAVDITDTVSGPDSSTVSSGAALGFSPISHGMAGAPTDSGA